MRVTLFCVAILAGLLFVANANVLTEDNYADMTKGKNHFIKFYAPWCGHCKKLAPDWTKLTDEFSGSSSVLIGEVDCTENQALCSAQGVTGYPTLKYFTSETSEDGERYSGAREFTAMKQFVDEELATPCQITDTEGCSEKEAKFIAKYADKSPEEVESQLSRLEGMTSSSMKAELKAWIKQRIAILTQFKSQHEEL